MKTVKSFCSSPALVVLGVALSTAAILMFIYLHWPINSFLAQPSQQAAKDLLEVASSYTNNLINIGMVVIGAIVTVLYRIVERNQLTKFEEVLIGLMFGLSGSSIGFGEEANAQLINSYAKWETITTVKGSLFDLANRFQFYSLIIGIVILLFFTMNHVTNLAKLKKSPTIE